MLETVLSRSVRLIYSGGMVIGLGLIAQPALAQQAAGETQRVEITGSNIRRAEAETASPVQTLNRADIEKSGKTTVAELLQTLAVDNQGSVPMSFGSGFAGGASGISLRGLGAASTLVLLNGRRVAPYGLADDGQKVFTDLNMIPVEAVERVEILKDGASAIYGSDAIAGVVNVILRKDFVGSTAKVTYGQSRYHDGRDVRAAMTHGFGNLDEDKFNILLNFEYGKKGEIWNRDRAGRDNIGRSDRRDIGFDANGFVGGVSASGAGAILSRNNAGSAINGNVRYPFGTQPDPDVPSTDPNYQTFFNRGNPAGPGFTRTFPGAACSNFTNHPQGDPGGGCVIDAQQRYAQIQPSQESFNFFARGTKLLSGSMQAYSELNLYNSRSQASNTPSGVHVSVGFPGGPVSNAGTQLGAAHPDNPYFGTAARLRYLADDVGPRVSDIESTFARVLAGLKGTMGAWDYDTAFLYSENKVSNERTGYIQRDVMRALLDPTAANITAANAASPAFRALGSTVASPVYWRIAENAGLNSRALYQAL
ncbi:MAG: iron complex outerrane recepter protein, partial [Burkholderiales bacterium]